MKVLLILFVVIKCVFSVSNNQICNNRNSVACVRKFCWQHPRCLWGREPHYMNFTPSQRNYIVELHNEFRNELAFGRFKGFPIAIKMLGISWDNEMEFYAGCHVKSCRFTYDHDRRSIRGHVMSQTIYLKKVPKNATYASLSNADILEAFTFWKQQIPTLHTLTQSFQYSGSGSFVYDFTVIASDVTWAIGCASFYYPYESYYARFIACNYRPNANQDSRPVYKAGDLSVHYYNRNGRYEFYEYYNNTASGCYRRNISWWSRWERYERWNNYFWDNRMSRYSGLCKNPRMMYEENETFVMPYDLEQEEAPQYDSHWHINVYNKNQCGPLHVMSSVLIMAFVVIVFLFK